MSLFFLKMYLLKALSGLLIGLPAVYILLMVCLCTCSTYSAVSRTSGIRLNSFGGAGGQDHNTDDCVFFQDAHRSGPDWCGSVCWALCHKWKGHWFGSLSGPVPGLQARSPAEGLQEATDRCFSCT